MTAVAVEVDADTGHVDVLDAVLVSDCGVVINPAVVEGQHQGGFAQGLGAVLLEEVRYDDDGQPLTSTLVDYTIPEAGDVPRLRVVHRETPSEVAGGFRGVGEAAIIAAPAVIAGAVADALGAARGRDHVDPAPPARAPRRDPGRGLHARPGCVRGAVIAVRHAGSGGMAARARAAMAATSSWVGSPFSTTISPPTATNAARAERPVRTRPARGSCTPTRSTVCMSQAAMSACIPGASAPRSSRPRHRAEPSVAMCSSSRADGQRRGSSGSVPRWASAAMRRSPSRFAPSFEALPVVPKPRRDAGVEVGAHGRATPAHAQVGRDQVRDRDAGGGHLRDLRGRWIDHVGQPGARLGPAVLDEQLPRCTAVPFARGVGVDLLVEMGVQPNLGMIGRERGQLVEERELVDVHAARRERHTYPGAGRRIVVRGDELRAVTHDFVDRLHDVGIGAEGERSAARVQAHADTGRGLDRRLHIRAGRARGMEVVLVGDGRDPAEH